MAYDFVRASSMYLEATSTPVTALPVTLAALASPNDIVNNHSILSLADKDGAGNYLSIEAGGGVASDPVRAISAVADVRVGASTSTSYSASVFQHMVARFVTTASRDAFLNGAGKGNNTSSSVIALIDSIQIGRNVAIAGSAQLLDGKVAYAAIWNTDLSDAEIALLGAGPPWIDPRQIKPNNLVYYRTLIRDLNHPYLGIGTLSAVNSPTVVDGPPLRNNVFLIGWAKVKDVTAPGVPTGLATTPVSASRIDLTWNASTGNPDHYNVYKDNVLYASPTGLSQSVTGLSEATTYGFKVSAVDGNGNESALSSNVNGTTLDQTAPSVPTGLAATPISETRIDLDWDDSTDNVGVDHYRIFKDAVFLANSATSSYSATGLTAGTTYAFRVSAVDAAGNESAQCTAVNSTTLDTTAPSVPTGLTVVSATGTSIVLDWDDSTDNVGFDHYRVFKDGVFLANSATSGYTATGLTPGVTYSFRVSAVDTSNNESAQSSAVTGKIPSLLEEPTYLYTRRRRN